MSECDGEDPKERVQWHWLRTAMRMRWPMGKKQGGDCASVMRKEQGSSSNSDCALLGLKEKNGWVLYSLGLSVVICEMTQMRGLRLEGVTR